MPDEFKTRGGDHGWWSTTVDFYLKLWEAIGLNVNRTSAAPEDPAFETWLRGRLESHPYQIRRAGKLCGTFARGDEAMRRAQHMGPAAEVWHVGPKYQVLDYMTQSLVRSDRAKAVKGGMSSGTAYRGQTTKIVTHRKVVGIVERRVH